MISLSTMPPLCNRSRLGLAASSAESSPDFRLRQAVSSANGMALPPRRVLWLLLVGCLLLGTLPAVALDNKFADLAEEPHRYWNRHPRDRFTRLMDAIHAGQTRLPAGNGDALATLRGFLELLEIPVSSQLLVFSATSLQSGIITPANPRAIYFNDDTSVGYIPGGRLEILSIDPELGAIFHIFDFPRENQLPYVDRSTRCMNCHSGDRQHFIPGYAVESVIPSRTGGTLEGYRRGKFGHGIPFEDRFGGWHVTGEGAITRHHGNLVGKLSPQGLKTTRHQPGDLFDWARYPVHSSDMLAHLLHEHQAGFCNLVIEGSYRVRFALHQSQGNLMPEQRDSLDEHARALVRYILFADEIPLPAGGVPGDPAYKAAFQNHHRKALPEGGASLRDLDLNTRLLRHRCSYMIHTRLWDAMPAPLKERVHHHLREALSLARPHPAFAYLPAAEKQTIRAILAHTKGLVFDD